MAAAANQVYCKLKVRVPTTLSAPLRLAFAAHFVALSAAHPILHWQQDPELPLEPHTFLTLCPVDAANNGELGEQTEFLLSLAAVHTLHQLPLAARTLAVIGLLAAIRIRSLQFTPFPDNFLTDEQIEQDELEEEVAALVVQLD